LTKILFCSILFRNLFTNWRLFFAMKNSKKPLAAIKKSNGKAIAKSANSKAELKAATAKKAVAAPKKVAVAPKKAAAKAPVKISTPVVEETNDRPAFPVEDKLTKDELEKFRHDLLELRQRVCAKVNTALQNVKHHNEAETGTEIGANVFDKFLALERAGNTQDLLTRIDEALARMNDGTYGLCLMCGRPIRRVRLEVQPFSKHCIKCQEELEKFLKR
jgi:RNA polymerase-binding protein DksA